MQLKVSVLVFVTCLAQAQSLGGDLVSKPRPRQARQAACQSITREQADEIVNELRKIRTLLETDPVPSAVSKTAPRKPASEVHLPVDANWHTLGNPNAPVTM